MGGSGFVNAHTHLELSGCVSPIAWPMPGPAMPYWITTLMRYRRSPEYDPGKAVRQALRSFHDEESGVPTVGAIGDIYQENLPLEVYAGTPRIAKRLFLELIGWTPERVAHGEAAARRFLSSWKSGAGDCLLLPGLSPHAPQTVHPALLSAAIELSLEYRIPLAVHLAESREEMQLLSDRSGPLLEMLRQVDPAYDPERVLLGNRPLDYLRVLSEAFHVMIVHGNYLDRQEIDYLARYSDRFSVVYCPRTHAYFGHSPYPLETMLAAGVRVALGTDSLASNPDLDIAREVDFVRKTFPRLREEEVLRMATRNGLESLCLP